MKRVGFFFELPLDEQRKQLRDLRQNEPHANKREILEYLASGVDAGVSMVVEEDVLVEPPRSLGSARLQSDGEWMWPASLSYYVREYDIRLPDEFVGRMKASDWRVPADVDFTPDIPEGHVEM